MASTRSATTVGLMERDANLPKDEPEAFPWLKHPEDYQIVAAAARSLRPLDWCYVRDAQAFVQVAQVTVVRIERGRVLFVDLADGKTLALEPDEPMMVRTSAYPT